MLSMQTFADFHNGIVNRNSFVLKNLLQHPAVNKILAVDYLHWRGKRLIKDYFQGVLSPKYAVQNLLRTPYSRACRVASPMLSSKAADKLFVYSTINQTRRGDGLLYEMSQLMEKLHMRENIVVWSYNPLFVDYFHAFGQTLNVFDTVDNWMTHSSHRNQQKLLERNYRKIAQKSDIIFTVSETLCEFYKSIGRNTDVHYIPNGVDLALFVNAPLASPYRLFFEKLKRPVLGYLGSITEDRVNIELLHEIAKKNQDKSLVLAGPVWRELAPKIRSAFSRFSNVHFLGRIAYSQAAAVMNQFDLCLNPHHLNAFIRFTDPMKLYEYLALGKPVVSVASAGLEKFSKHVELATSFEDFHAKIQTGLKNNTLKQVNERKKFAKAHTYAKRADTMLDLIFEKMALESSSWEYEVWKS